VTIVVFTAMPIIPSLAIYDAMRVPVRKMPIFIGFEKSCLATVSGLMYAPTDTHMTPRLPIIANALKLQKPLRSQFRDAVTLLVWPRLQARPKPGNDGSFGRIEAIDLKTRQGRRWWRCLGLRRSKPHAGTH